MRKINLFLVFVLVLTFNFSEWIPLGQLSTFNRIFAAEPGLLFSEDFSKGAGKWEELIGAWETQKGEYVGTGDGESTSGDEGWKDYVYEVRLKAEEPGEQSWNVGIVTFRFMDKDNRYFVLLHTSKLLELGKRQDGQYKPGLKTVKDVADPKQWNTIRVDVKKDNIKVYVNGELKIDFTDPEPMLEGKIGFWISGATTVAKFDDVKVRGSGEIFEAGGIKKESVEDMKKEEPVTWDFEKIAKAPLDIEVIEEASSGNVRVQTVYFTSEKMETYTYRVFGYYACPDNASENEKVPGLLLVHGGGGTADKNGAVRGAGQGYACLSIDWNGKAPGRERYSDWGKLNRGINTLAMNSNDDFIRAVATAVMRSITFLVNRPEVDAGRIGLEGGSWGSYLSMLVNGLDKRIKTIVARHGCGGFEFEDSKVSRVVNTASRLKRQRWYNYYDPLAYAGKPYGSVLMINATNDAFMWLNSADMNFKSLNQKEKTQIIVSNLDHQSDAATSACTAKWEESKLKGANYEFPETPKTTLAVKDNKLILKIETGRNPEIEDAEAYCSYGPGKWPGKYWHRANVKREGKFWTAELPVLDINDTIAYFATVVAENGTRSSSGLGEVVAKDVGITRANCDFKPLLDDFEDGIGSWLAGDYLFATQKLESEQENSERGNVLRVKILGAGKKPYAIRTHKIEGYLLNKFGFSGISFRVDHSTISSQFKVVLCENEFQKNERRRTVTVKKKEDAGWEEIKIPFSEINNLNLENVDALWITGESDSSLSPSFDEFKVYK